MVAKDFYTIVVAFVASRAIYGFLGVTYDASPMDSFLQFIDPVLLKNAFWQSLYYYHAGPPMLNLVAGFGLGVFEANAYWFYAILFHVLGLCLVFSVFFITNRLCGSRPSAWVATLLICFSPSFVLYENWLMYTFIASSLLICSAALLIKYLDSDRFIWGFLFFVCIAMLSLTRTFFLFYWLVLVLLILVIVRWQSRKQILVCAFVPLLVCFCWNAKNFYLFNTFSSSSITGLSLNNVTTLTVPWDVLRGHVEKGELSRFALVSRYGPLHKAIERETLAEFVGVPVLDNATNSNGQLNFNSLEMLVASNHYLKDSLQVLKMYPRNYMSAVLTSHMVYLSPASLNPYFSVANLQALQSTNRFLDRLLYGTSLNSVRVEQPHFGYNQRYSIEVKPGVVLAFFSGIIFLYGSWRCLLIVFTRDWRTHSIVFGYLFGTWLLVYLAGVYFELSENNRYRFVAEPVFWIIVVLMVNHLWRSRSGRPVSLSDDTAAVRRGEVTQDMFQ
ncbi:MAG TPA: hypothetical protein DCS89_01030 [Gammaproteobacteria bacterium]|nr:hypothetical protein [Gammaproteobacteria bacterium]